MESFILSFSFILFCCFAIFSSSCSIFSYASLSNLSFVSISVPSSWVKNFEALQSWIAPNQLWSASPFSPKKGSSISLFIRFSHKKLCSSSGYRCILWIYNLFWYIEEEQIYLIIYLRLVFFLVLIKLLINFINLSFSNVFTTLHTHSLWGSLLYTYSDMYDFISILLEVYLIISFTHKLSLCDTFAMIIFLQGKYFFYLAS